MVKAKRHFPSTLTVLVLLAVTSGPAIAERIPGESRRDGVIRAFDCPSLVFSGSKAFGSESDPSRDTVEEAEDAVEIEERDVEEAVRMVSDCLDRSVLVASFASLPTAPAPMDPRPPIDEWDLSPLGVTSDGAVRPGRYVLTNGMRLEPESATSLPWVDSGWRRLSPVVRFRFRSSDDRGRTTLDIYVDIPCAPRVVGGPGLPDDVALRRTSYASVGTTGFRAFEAVPIFTHGDGKVFLKLMERVSAELRRARQKPTGTTGVIRI